jgi:ABC-2 type transport system ATP-binding protein
LKKAGLLNRANDLVGTFSRGMKQRLAIVRAILHNPRILILDEPTTGLDIQSKRSFYEMVEELHSKGATILLTTHHLEEAEQLCQKAAIMDRGKIKIMGELSKIKEGVETLEETFIRLTE